MNFTGDIEKDQYLLNEKLPIANSFDLIGRDLTICGKKGYIVFVSSLVNSDLLLRIMQYINNPDSSYQFDSVQDFINDKILFVDAKPVCEVEQVCKSVLSGQLLLVIDGYAQAVLIDARQYPNRSIEESTAESVSKGSHEAFVETMLFNTALIRKRLHDPRLIFEQHTVGTRSQTDCAVCYIAGKVKRNVLENVRKRLEEINPESLVMAEKSLQELIIKTKWYNPFPPVRYTERPDIVAAHLLEGHIAIIVDTSPSVMLLPVSIFSFFEKAEDYNQAVLTSSHFKLINVLSFFLGVFLLPAFLMGVRYMNLMPAGIQRILEGIKKLNYWQVFFQIVLIEIFLDMLKLSSFQIVKNLSSSFTIVATIILGEMAVSSHYLNPEVIFFIGLAAVATSSVSNVELSAAMRVTRFILVLITGVFGIIGFCAALALLIIVLFNTDTLDNRTRYTWPLIPFNLKGIAKMFARKTVK